MLARMSATQVSCRVCGHSAQTLARHLKAAHGITADEYRARFPDARIRSEACETNRRAAITKAHAEKPREGLKKTVDCPYCGSSHEVGWSAPKSLPCATCKARLEEEAWAGKTEGEDFVVCLSCGHRAENLTSHVQNAHPEMIGCYPGQMVAMRSSVRDKTALKGRTVSDETRAKMSANAGWNRGLTKETDPRVARAAEAMVGRASWSKGFTKANHPSLRSSSEKQSLVRRGVRQGGALPRCTDPS